MIANNAASLDGKLRTLVVGVEDAQGDDVWDVKSGGLWTTMARASAPQRAFKRVGTKSQAKFC